MVMDPLKLIPVLLYGAGYFEQNQLIFRYSGLDLLPDLMPDVLLLDPEIQIIPCRLEHQQEKTYYGGGDLHVKGSKLQIIYWLLYKLIRISIYAYFVVRLRGLIDLSPGPSP